MKRLGLRIILVACLLFGTLITGNAYGGIQADLGTFFETVIGAKVMTAIASNNLYQTEVMDSETEQMVPNPQTKKAFAIEMVKEYFRREFTTYKENIVQVEARDAINLVESEVTAEIGGL